MNVPAIKEQLASQYPGVNIKENPNAEGIVTEIIGEIDRKLVGSERDVAVVVADTSTEHWHNVIEETYVVIKGNLRVWKNGQPSDLKEGDSIVIEPGTKHYVEGDETWFFCYSVPDWFPGDYRVKNKFSLLK